MWLLNGQVTSNSILILLDKQWKYDGLSNHRPATSVSHRTTLQSFNCMNYNAGEGTTLFRYLQRFQCCDYRGRIRR